MIAKACDVNFKVYTQAQRVKIDGERFKMLPYPFTDTEKGCVNVGHFEIKGSMRDNGRVIEEGVETRHQGVMGHLHTNHRVGRMHYSGTLYQTNFGESEAKFFHHCKVNENTLRVNNIPFTPPWVLRNVKINTPEDAKQLEPDPDNRVLYKVFVKNGLDIDIDTLLKKVPNIVKTNFFKTKQELQLMLSEGWKLDQDLVDQSVSLVDERKVVHEWLAKSHQPEQVKRGLKILDRLRGV